VKYGPLNRLTILRTQDIMVELIRGTVVSIEAADAILVDWAAKSFQIEDHVISRRPIGR
jgi:hypothetical protein